MREEGVVPEKHFEPLQLILFISGCCFFFLFFFPILFHFCILKNADHYRIF